MTPRRERHRRLTTSDVPALAEFARGYLHQDLAIDYGDAVGAVGAFRRDASGAERAALAGDLQRLIRTSRRWSAAKVSEFFTDVLGAAWAPSTSDDLAVMRDALVKPT